MVRSSQAGGDLNKASCDEGFLGPCDSSLPEIVFYRVTPRRRFDLPLRTGKASIGLVDAKADAKGVAKPNTIEERLDELEKQVVQLKESLGLVKQALDKERTERIEADDLTRSASSTQIAEIRTLMQKLTVDSFSEEIIGLVWLVFSAVCTTLSADLASVW